MRVAGRVAAQAMAAAAELIAPGVTTDELDAVAHEYLLDHGAYPSVSYTHLTLPTSDLV